MLRGHQGAPGFLVARIITQRPGPGKRQVRNDEEPGTGEFLDAWLGLSST